MDRSRPQPTRILHTSKLTVMMLLGTVAAVGCLAKKPSFQANEYRRFHHSASLAEQDSLFEVGQSTSFEGITLSPAVPGEPEEIFGELEHAASATITLPRRDVRKLPSSFHWLTLEEALQLALSNSRVLRDLGGSVVAVPDSVATTWDPVITRTNPIFGPLGTVSEYDSRWFTSLTSAQNDRVFNNVTIGGGATELQQSLVNGRTGVARRGWNGAIWELSQITIYDANNRQGNFFPNAWDQLIEGGVRQPLLRGAGREFNEIAGPNAAPGFQFFHGYRIASIRADVSEVDFINRLQAYLVAVEEAYWQLLLAYNQYEVLVETTDLAEQVYRSVRAKFEMGLEGGEADREAEAKATWLRFKQLQQQALGGGGSIPGIYTAELTLRRMIGFTNESHELLRPASRSPSAPVHFDEDEVVQRGIALRPELAQQRLKVREEELKLLAAKNFTLPQADLFGRYRVRGFGDRWFGSGPRFASAWQEVGNMNYQEWEFGLEMEAPYQQRQAREGVRFAQLQLTRARAILDEQEWTIRYGIMESIVKLDSTYYAMQYATAGLEAAEQRVQSAMAQFDVDRVPLERVREAQEALLLAAEQASLAQLEYARAVRDIQAQSGTYLQEWGVSLQ